MLTSGPSRRDKVIPFRGKPKPRFYWTEGHWFCREHQQFPCSDCGSYHYEGCNCVFCQQRKRRGFSKAP